MDGPSRQLLIVLLIIGVGLIAFYPTHKMGYVWKSESIFEQLKSTEAIINHASTPPYQYRYVAYVPLYYLWFFSSQTVQGWVDPAGGALTFWYLSTVCTLVLSIFALVWFYLSFREWFTEWSVILAIFASLFFARFGQYWTWIDAVVLLLSVAFWNLIFKGETWWAITLYGICCLCKESFLFFIPVMIWWKEAKKRVWLWMSIIYAVIFIALRLLYGFSTDAFTRPINMSLGGNAWLLIMVGVLILAYALIFPPMRSFVQASYIAFLGFLLVYFFTAQASELRVYIPFLLFLFLKKKSTPKKKLR